MSRDHFGCAKEFGYPHTPDTHFLSSSPMFGGPPARVQMTPRHTEIQILSNARILVLKEAALS
jgi:hypothetical protein